jgi:O-antigen ligase
VVAPRAPATGADRHFAAAARASRGRRLTRPRGRKNIAGVAHRAPSIDLRAAPVAVGAAAATIAAVSALTIGPAALALPLALGLGLLLVREPLALLTLYTYIGLFKEQDVVAALPIDATLALGLLLSGVCFARWLGGRAHTIPLGLVAPLAVVAVLLAVSLAWTPSPGYGGEKALRFATLTALAALAPFFLVEDQRDLRRLLAWIVALAGFAAVVTLANPPATADRLTIGMEGNTIGLSQLLCAGALILLIGTLTDLFRARSLALGSSAALIGVAAAIGSRGPLLCLGLALVVTGVVFLARVPHRTAPVMLVVVAGVALLPFVSLPEGSAERLGRAASHPVTALQEDPRYTSFGQAVDLIEEHPLLGVGAGGFQSVGRFADPPEDYPHNMFLEVWSELGLAAFLVLAGSVMVVLAALWRAVWRLPPGGAFQLLYVFNAIFLLNLFSAQLSGDLIQNRTYWGAFGLAWLIVHSDLPARRDASGRQRA